MTTETETRLRAAFHAAEGAITVDDATSGVEMLRRPEALPRHRSAQWALAAAAAVIVAVAALAIALRAHSTTPPAVTPTTPVPTSTAPVVQRGPQPESCDVTLPAAWRAVISAGRVPGHLQLETIDSGGNAYAVQTLGTTSQLVQVLPDRSVRTVYRAPAGSRVDDTQVDGGWAVMALIYGGNPNGDGEARGRPSAIVAIRVGARQDDAITIRPGSSSVTTLLQPPVISHGIVYWSTGDNTGAGTMHSYALVTRERRVLDKGLINWPFVTGGGVYWFKGVYGHAKLHTERAGTLPAGYSLADAAKLNGAVLESNGNDAWQATVHAQWVLRVAQGGHRYVTVVRPANTDQNLTADALSGSYLFYDDGLHLRVLDWTTGAAATLPAASIYGNAEAGGGMVALQTGDGAISLVRTADLPALRC